MTKAVFAVTVFLVTMVFLVAAPRAHAAPCLIVTLTGQAKELAKQAAKLTEADFKKTAKDGGFTGNIIVGTDLASVRLPAK